MLDTFGRGLGDTVPDSIRFADSTLKVSQTIEGRATYKGDVRDIVASPDVRSDRPSRSHVMGPGRSGRMYIAALAEYDASSDQTVVGFAHVEPSEVTR